MWLAVFGIAILYVGSTLPTPLYPTYRQVFRLSELDITLIYAAYVIGNLTVLFFFGRLSDQIGRRVTAIVALAAAMLSALLFFAATGRDGLYAARICNGVAAGLGAGALTAWIAELEPGGNRERASVLASAGNLVGLAAGAIAAGMLAHYIPWPLHASYAVYAVLMVLVIAALIALPETVPAVKSRLSDLSLRPRLGVPPGIRMAFVTPAALAFTAFALAGFYAALTPGLLARTLGQGSTVVIGAVVGGFFVVAAMVAVMTAQLGIRRAVAATVLLLLVGISVLLAAEAKASMPLLLAATALTGAAMAIGYRASLQIINRIAPAKQRAEVISSYLMVCYLANSLPVVGVGLLAQRGGAALAHWVFGAALCVIAAGASAMGWRYLPDD